LVSNCCLIFTHPHNMSGEGLASKGVHLAVRV
jgi:hypothetical protein